MFSYYLNAFNSRGRLAWLLGNLIFIPGLVFAVFESKTAIQPRASLEKIDQQIDLLEYITEEFPPYNFVGRDGALQGLNVELLRETLKLLGRSKNTQNILVKPWAVAYQEAQDPAKKNVLFSTVRMETRERLFKWVGPLSYADTAIFTLKNNPYGLQVGKNNNLKRFHCGAVLDDVGHLNLKKQGIRDGNILLTVSFKELIEKLAAKQIQCIAYSEAGGKLLMQQEGFNPKDYDVVSRKGVGQYYLAFNKSIPDEIVHVYQRALTQVLNDPTYMLRLYARYLN